MWGWWWRRRRYAGMEEEKFYLQSPGCGDPEIVLDILYPIPRRY